MNGTGAGREEPPHGRRPSPGGTDLLSAPVPAAPVRRGRAPLFGGVGVLLLALVTGLLAGTSGSGPGTGVRASERNRVPFERALDDLAGAPGLRYRETAAAGGNGRDITATASGIQFGSTDDAGNRGREVLRIDGRTFTRPLGAPLFVEPAGAGDLGFGSPGGWRLGSAEESGPLDEALDRFPAPEVLAAQLSGALGELDELPDPNDPEQLSLTVDGVPALRADTSAGGLVVAKEPPYRVLRLEPYDTPERAGKLRAEKALSEIPRVNTGSLTNGDSGQEGTPGARRVTTGPLAGGGSRAIDLSPVTGDGVPGMYDTLEKRTKQLDQAVDARVVLTLDSSGKLDCGAAGCSVRQGFTGKLSGEAGERMAGGRVTAVLSADVTVDGQPAGGCTSARGTFPVSGGTVSGTLSCSVPEAGPAFSAAEARHKAVAEARSRAAGGIPVRYSFFSRATTTVNACALPADGVKRLLDLIRKERRDAEKCAAKPHSFPPGTPVLMADGTRRDIEDVRVGDRVTATEPRSGTTAARPVTDVITTEDDKDFTRLTVAADRGPRGSAVVTATDTHPFWLVNRDRWVEAEDIRTGDTLRTPEGKALTVTDVSGHRTSRRTHDLTVAGVHTYYVLAGDAPVLVHNTDCGVGDALKGWRTRYYQVGGQHLRLTKERMQHILERHHPAYRKGPDKANQTNFRKGMTIGDVEDAIRSVVRQNRGLMSRKGVHDTYQVEGVHGGVRYTMGVSNGRIGQFYPMG